MSFVLLCCVVLYCVVGQVHVDKNLQVRFVHDWGIRAACNNVNYCIIGKLSLVLVQNNHFNQKALVALIFSSCYLQTY